MIVTLYNGDRVTFQRLSANFPGMFVCHANKLHLLKGIKSVLFPGKGGKAWQVV